MQDAIIVSEVAVLAHEAAMLVIEESPSHEALDTLKKASLSQDGELSPSQSQSTLLPRLRFGSVSFENHPPPEMDEHSSEEADDSSHSGRVVEPPSRPTATMRFSDVTYDDSNLHKIDDTVTADIPSTSQVPPRRHPALSRTDSGNFRIKETLERWEEPATKSDKVRTVSHGWLLHSPATLILTRFSRGYN